MSKNVKLITFMLGLIFILVASSVSLWVIAGKKPVISTVSSDTTPKEPEKEPINSRMTTYLDTHCTFSTDYRISDYKFGGMPSVVEGSATGKKVGNELYVDFMYEDEEALELYVNIRGEAMYAITPFFYTLFNKVGSDTGIQLDLYGIVFNINAFLDKEGIIELIGQDFTDLVDSGLNLDLFKNISQFNPMEKKNYRLKTINPIESDLNTVENGVFYQIDIDEKGTKMIIAYPENASDNELYVNITYDEATWEFMIKYEPDNTQVIKHPDKKITETQKVVYRKLFDTWVEQSEDSDEEEE